MRTELFAALLLVACGQGEAPPSTLSAPSMEVAPVEAPQAVTWEGELADVDEQIAFHEARFRDKGSWLEADAAAAKVRQRARLSGDYDDYARAEVLIAEAFAAAPQGSGPFMGRARLHFTLHRLPAAEAEVNTVAAQPVRTPSATASMADLRADIALERGQLDVAEAHYKARESAEPTMGTAAGVARVAWLRGEFAAADAGFAESLSRYHGRPQEPVAWAHLQRGLIALDQGDAAGALRHYEAAEAALPGYWLVDEHIAEALLLTGQTEAALARYRDVVGRTGNPELQGALAELLLSQGQEAEARELVARADATYAEQLARFPEAATGHALEHALTWGADPAVALAMAERNAALRPSGLALAQLSEAFLAAGDPAGAADAARRGLATGTRSARLFLAAAAAAQAEGESAEAEGFLADAKGLDPTAALED